MTEAPSLPAEALAKEGAILYATAKPETPKPESKIVTGVKKAVNSWLERVGPKGVENHHMKAYENILNTFTDEQRKELFTKEIEGWRKAAKFWGIAATVVDTSLIAYATGMSFLAFRNPSNTAGLFNRITFHFIGNFGEDNKISQLLLRPYSQLMDREGLHNTWTLSKQNETKIAHTIGALFGLGTLAMTLGSGPGHWLAHLAASGAETVGKMKAKSPSKK